MQLATSSKKAKKPQKTKPCKISALNEQNRQTYDQRKGTQKNIKCKSVTQRPIWQIRCLYHAVTIKGFFRGNLYFFCNWTVKDIHVTGLLVSRGKFHSSQLGHCFFQFVMHCAFNDSMHLLLKVRGCSLSSSFLFNTQGNQPFRMISWIRLASFATNWSSRLRSF